MPKVSKETGERQRLDALHELEVLDTPREAMFDQLTELACLMFSVPIALVSLIDADRQWFKSCQGLDVRETARELAFCDFAIREDAVMVVADAAEDLRFANNDLVTGEPNIRFYAGAPLRYNGIRIGTLCIIDRSPRRNFGPEEVLKLKKLAAATSSALAMRKQGLTNAAIIRTHEEDQRTLQLVEDIAGVGQWSFDIPTGRVTWSDQVFRIHGLPIQNEAPDYNIVLSLYEPDDAAKLEKLVERAILTGEGYSLDARIRRPDGTIRTVVAKASTVRDERGLITAIQGVFQDITDYRSAVDTAQQSEARYRLLAEKMPGMLGYWDNELICRFANNAYLDWFGRRQDELIGVHLQELLGDELFSLNHPNIRSVLSGEKQTFERAVTRRCGETRYVLAQYLPDFTLRGTIQGFYILLTDITNLKLKELALSDSNAQLIAARKLAEDALNVKAEFLATMSHEIRTPLTTILGYANLLEAADDLSEESLSFVTRIRKAGRTLLGLLNDVLDVSRFEAGQVKLNPQALDIVSLGNDIMEQFQEQATSRNLKLVLSYDETLPRWQLIDEIRFNQVLNNLVGNACKFSADGTITLWIGKVDHLMGDHLRVEVRDPGPGLTSEQMEKLFNRFTQLDSSISRRHGGSGLGLAICAEIIKLMQGKIGVESSPGEGSTFWFEIPLTRAVTPPADSERQAALVNTGVRHRILVVDDHPVTRKMIKALLLPHVTHVAEASDGAEAINLCMAEAFDLIFMDIQMPVINGIEAARTIGCASAFNAHTPMVALTGMTEDQLATGVSEPLFDQFIAKPIEPQKILAALNLCKSYETECAA